MTGQQPLASVVVPTRNRAVLLPALLAALDAQDYPAVEIIVVDDAAQDETWDVLQRWQQAGGASTPEETAASAVPREGIESMDADIRGVLHGPPRGGRPDGAAPAADPPEITRSRVALRLEKPSGSYVARNAGWRAAHGEIVAFTDDDCIPRPGWLSALVAAIDGDAGAAGAQGVTLAMGGERTPFTHQIEQTRPGPPYRTCNIAYTRAILESLGGFDGSLRWYADNILGLEVRERGIIAFAPDAVVDHPPRPREWRDRAAWRARFAADARHRAALYRHGLEVPMPRSMLRLALPVMLWIVRPVLKQGPAHLRYLLRHPAGYRRQIGPMAREKWELMLALREQWMGKRAQGTASRDHGGPHELLPRISDQPLISAVVVTRGDRNLLQGALDALGRQTWTNREVIVVLHGSTDPGAQETPGTIRFVSVPGAWSLGAARQAGVEAARGEIVAFTDDDCLPDPDWLAALADAFQAQPALWGVQGRTVAEPGPPGAHAVRVAGPDPLYQTCNMAYRRAALERVRGFDTDFDGWFEDTALGARITARGPVGFFPEALVTHRAVSRQPRDRSTWRRVLADERRLARSYPDFYRAARGPGFLPVVIGRWLLGSPARALWRALPRAGHEPVAYLAFVWQLAVERVALLRALLDIRPSER